jgi:hypothetical protein
MALDIATLLLNANVICTHTMISRTLRTQTSDEVSWAKFGDEINLIALSLNSTSRPISFSLNKKENAIGNLKVAP